MQLLGQMMPKLPCYEVKRLMSPFDPNLYFTAVESYHTPITTMSEATI